MEAAGGQAESGARTRSLPRRRRVQCPLPSGCPGHCAHGHTTKPEEDAHASETGRIPCTTPGPVAPVSHRDTHVRAPLFTFKFAHHAAHASEYYCLQCRFRACPCTLGSRGTVFEQVRARIKADGRIFAVRRRRPTPLQIAPIIAELSSVPDPIRTHASRVTSRRVCF